MLILPPKIFDKKFQLTIWSGKVFYSQKFYGIFLCLVLKYIFTLGWNLSVLIISNFFLWVDFGFIFKSPLFVDQDFFVLSQAEGGIYF